MKKIILSLAILISIATAAQTTIELVADINQKPKDSDLKPGIVHNGKYYFGAPNDQNVTVLHVYDGTGVPTVAPGVNGASNQPGRNPADFAIFNNKLYFNGYQSWKGNELMEYDFAAAPKMTSDIYSNGQASSQPGELTVFNNKLYFVATELTNGRELWMYDGTNPPTLAADINPGAGSSTPHELTVYDGKLYFVATDENQDIELYEYDGTNAPKKYNINTQTTGNSTSISSKPQYLTVCNDTLYFRAKGTDNIQDLYEFNSTDSFKLAYVWSGTRRHIYPTYLASYKNKLYFNGIPQWGQYNLIEFDGHNTPTVVHFINGVGNHSQSVDMTTVGDELFFRANTYDKGYELYRYNGVDTPKLVIDMVPGTGTSVPQNFVDFNGDLIYTAFDLINGRELRRLQTGSKTSGIPELIADYSPGNESSMPFNLMEYNDKLYFAAEDGVHGRELWEYDGTNEPELVSNFTIGNGHSLSTNMPKPVVYKNKMVYLGAQSSFPYLMEYDGDTLIAKVNMYQQDFRTVSTQMIVFKDNVYFDAFKFSNRRELYKYDGDTITLVADINPTGDASPGDFFIYKDKLYFGADDGVKGRELWVYDGTNPPTMAAEINEGGNGSPTSFQELNGKLYFLANNGTDTKIFEYDGSSAPKQIEQGNLRAHQSLSKHDNKLYFSAWDGSSQPELYEYDGSNVPKLVADIHSQYGSSPREMTSYNGLLYFAATNDTRGREMWTYDGTDTVCIDHYPGSNSLEPQNMLMYKEKLYFMGRTENNGYELFRLTAPKAVNGVTKKFVQSISVYPNPSKDIVTIDMNHQVTKVSIFNISGQEVQSLKNTKTVDISTLPSGVYTFIIETEDTVGYAKVIKE